MSAVRNWSDFTISARLKETPSPPPPPPFSARNTCLASSGVQSCATRIFITRTAVSSLRCCCWCRRGVSRRLFMRGRGHKESKASLHGNHDSRGNCGHACREGVQGGCAVAMATSTIMCGAGAVVSHRRRSFGEHGQQSTNPPTAATTVIGPRPRGFRKRPLCPTSVCSEGARVAACAMSERCCDSRGQAEISSAWGRGPPGRTARDRASAEGGVSACVRVRVRA